MPPLHPFVSNQHQTSWRETKLTPSASKCGMDSPNFPQAIPQNGVHHSVPKGLSRQATFTAFAIRLRSAPNARPKREQHNVMLTLPLESWGVRWIEALVTLSASTLKEWPITRMVALLRGHASVRLSVSQGRRCASLGVLAGGAKKHS